MAERSLTDCGERLRRAREARGISLRQVANVTRITVRALEAVERNDPSRLPGGIFTRAFVRAYATEVGLDPEVTLREFLAQSHEEGAAVPTAAHHGMAGEPGSWRERVRFRRIAIAVLLLALAGAAAYAVVRWNGARQRPRADGTPRRVAADAPLTASASSVRLP